MPDDDETTPSTTAAATYRMMRRMLVLVMGVAAADRVDADIDDGDSAAGEVVPQLA